MISLSGGLKTTGYYAKASRPPDDFHGGFAVRGYRYAQPPVIYSLRFPVLRTM